MPAFRGRRPGRPPVDDRGPQPAAVATSQNRLDAPLAAARDRRRRQPQQIGAPRQSPAPSGDRSAGGEACPEPRRPAASRARARAWTLRRLAGGDRRPGPRWIAGVAAVDDARSAPLEQRGERRDHGRASAEPSRDALDRIRRSQSSARGLRSTRRSARAAPRLRFRSRTSALKSSSAPAEGQDAGGREHAAATIRARRAPAPPRRRCVRPRPRAS